MRLLVATILVLLEVESAAAFLAFQFHGAKAVDSALRGLSTNEHARSLALSVLPGVALFVSVALAALVFIQRRGRESSPSSLGEAFVRAAWALAPLALLGPVLFYDHIPGRMILAASLVGASAWLAWPLARVGFPGDGDGSSWGAPTRRADAVALALALASFAFMAIGATARHDAHWSSLIDLGLYYELYDNARGELLYSPTLGHHFFGEHFTPVLYLLTPLMRAFPTPVTLLVVQAAALSTAGLLLYGYARDRVRHSAVALAFMAAWLLNPYLQQAAFYDFHADMLEPAMIFGAVWAIHRGRTWPVWLCAILLWATKEDTFIYTSVLGFYAATIERRRTLGLTLIVVGLVQAWFVIAHVIPDYRAVHDPSFFSTVGKVEGYHFLSRYSHLGGGFGSIAVTLLTNPIHVLGHLLSGHRLTSVMALVASFGFLAVGGRWRMILLVPVLEILLANPGRMSRFAFYYGALALPFAAVAAVEGARALIRDPPRWWPGVTPGRLALLVAAITLPLAMWHPSSRLSRHATLQSWVRTPHQVRAEELMAEIPPGASVSATGYLAVHLQPGRDVTMFPYGADEARFVLVDLQRPPWPRKESAVRARLRRLVSSGMTILAAEEDGLILLERPERLREGGRDKRRKTRAVARAADIDRMRALLNQSDIEAELTEQTKFRGRARLDRDAANGAYVRVDPSDRRGSGHVLFGPYLTFKPGKYVMTARFRYANDEPARWADEPAVTFDVVNGAKKKLATRKLDVADAVALAAEWTEIEVPFRVRAGDSKLETRVWYGDLGTLDVDVVRVRPVDGGR